MSCLVRSEFPIVDELRGVWMQGNRGDLGEEGVAFDLAMGAEACGDAVEVAVIVAGMADEFEGSGRRECGEDLTEGVGGQIARG